MKVIFLDHDGVVCLASEWGSRHKRGTTFDRLNQKAVKILNEILVETGAEIVVSSDWKLHCTLEEMEDVYKQEGIIKAPIAFTGRYNPTRMSETWDLERNRQKEIKEFLESHPEITHWVAVDDLKMFELGNFVHCPKSNEGIKQSGIKEKIINFLK